MTSSEDTAPESSTYPYSWAPDSGVTLDDFLKKRPSMVEDDGTKPWIWVKGSNPSREDTNRDAALQEAATLLKEVTVKIEKIKNDPSIPVRSSKKTGARSKKELREEAQGEATAKLREIALRHGFLSGKWLVFASPDKVDAIWNRLAHSLVSGPLAQTPAFLSKVSTTPKSSGQHHQHVICVYLPNIFDKDEVTKVMKVLLRDHGLNLSGAKSNLYTGINLDSKHPSGVPSTTWKNTSLLTEDEIKQLKDEFFSDLEAAKSKKDNTEAKTNEDKEDRTTGVTVSKPKPKPKLQLKKKADDDPFASDEEEEVKPKAKASKPPLNVASKPPSGRGGAVKKPSSEVRTGTKRIREDSEPEEEVNPKAKILRSKE